MVACNDYIILESCIYRVLKKHFARRSFYPQLLDIFHEVPATYPCTTHAVSVGAMSQGACVLLCVESCHAFSSHMLQPICTSCIERARTHVACLQCSVERACLAMRRPRTRQRTASCLTTVHC